MEEGQFLREVGIFFGAQIGKKLLRVEFGVSQNLPDFVDDFLEEIEVALFRGHDAFPVPLIDIDTVIVIEEVVLADGAHVGAETFAETHAEIAKSGSLPLGGGLNDLSIDGMLIAIIGNVELNGSAGTIAIEHVVDAAFDVHEKRHGDHDEVQLFAEMVLDEAFNGEDGFLGIAAIEGAAVVGREDLLEFFVIADAGTCKIGDLGICHGETSGARVCLEVGGSQCIEHGSV